MKKSFLLFTSLFIFTFCNCSFSYAETWQELLERRFDLVETFDNLQDWVSKTCPDCSMSDLPKKIDGTPSNWGRYCMYAEPTPDKPVIRDHGPDKQVGTKSLSFMPNDYMLIYFGDGTPGNKYSDLYLFFRVYFPHNLFPTRVIETRPKENRVLLDYVDGERYIWWDAFKFVNINTGFTSATSWNYRTPGAYEDRYGDTEIWFNLYRDNSTNNIRPQLLTFYSKRVVRNNSGIELDKLIGMEIHCKLEKPAGYSPGYMGNGVVEMWAYDENGKPDLILQATDMSFRPSEGEGHLFNRIQIAGNRHTGGQYWLYGPGMVKEFYIDDLIIDDKRIGPEYYALLNKPTAVNPKFEH